ncbi:MAG: hypothetical protein IJ014_01600 [Rikenellaceae bacterium]|nr:hypothetical protein [Rikenellaceae bacterium]
MDDSRTPLRAKITEVIADRSNYDQQVFDNTYAVMGKIKSILHELSADLDDELEETLEDGVQIDYRDRGRFAARLYVGEDVIHFGMHSNVFCFPVGDPIWQLPYMAENRRRGYCGIINIYNFLADSFNYNRPDDEGYLIGRIFINHDKSVHLDGPVGDLLPDVRFNGQEVTHDVLERIIETAVNYAVQFDMLVPPYEKVKRVVVEPFTTKDETPKIPTGKRINHDF